MGFICAVIRGDRYEYDSLNDQLRGSLHGGAFIVGNNDSEDLINRQLAVAAGVLVFFLDYSMAPEDVVDVIFKDADDGLKWVCLRT